jgi:phospho-N-acetylmuramoyl-pentapeptide-transferase
MLKEEKTVFYYLFDYLSQFNHSFAVFHYITVRTIFSALTAFIFSLAFGPAFIRRLQHLQLGQVVRDDGPQSHLAKTGTPTMGGGLILIAILVSSILWGHLNNRFLWVALAVMLANGFLGFRDDYQKIAKKNTKGVSAREKLLVQIFIAVLAVGYLYFTSTTGETTHLIIPFIKHLTVNLGWFFLIFGTLVIVGAGNAVNLTDGLDGLAILPVVLVAAALGVFAYVTSNFHYAAYLLLPHISGSGECVVLCGAVVGAGLGFLWFNAYPAQIFMGDVGSLGLGSLLGIIAVIIRQELVLFIMGGIFVLETVSVILQVGSFKLRGKRIFKMAPIHHHFELKGWSEPKVIVRFWIITFVLVLIGLASLKIR